MNTPFITLESLARKAYQKEKDELKSSFALNSADERMRDRQAILERLHHLLPGQQLDFELHPQTNTVVLLDVWFRWEFCLIKRVVDEKTTIAHLGLIRACSKCRQQETVEIVSLADLGQALELGTHPNGCPKG